MSQELIITSLSVYACVIRLWRLKNDGGARDQTEAFLEAGEPRQTLKGTPLAGCSRETYWTGDIIAGRWPLRLNEAVHDTLKRLARYRPFLHRLRAESGDVLSYQCLAFAGELKIDLAFDVYAPDQPQNEREIVNPLLLQQ